MIRLMRTRSTSWWVVVVVINVSGVIVTRGFVRSLSVLLAIIRSSRALLSARFCWHGFRMRCHLKSRLVRMTSLGLRNSLRNRLSRLDIVVVRIVVNDGLSARGSRRRCSFAGGKWRPCYIVHGRQVLYLRGVRLAICVHVSNPWFSFWGYLGGSWHRNRVNP